MLTQMLEMTKPWSEDMTLLSMTDLYRTKFPMPSIYMRLDSP